MRTVVSQLLVLRMIQPQVPSDSSSLPILPLAGRFLTPTAHFFFATVDPSIHIQSAYGSATGTDGTLADYRYYMNSVIICTGLFSTQTCAMNAVQAFGVIEVGGDFSSLPNFPGAGTNTSISLLLSTAPLDSVPEPTTLLLSGSGFLALGVIAFVRQKRSRE